MTEGELTDANALFRLRQFYLLKDILTVFRKAECTDLVIT